MSELEAALAAVESEASESSSKTTELKEQLDAAVKASEESAAKVAALETELASAYEDQEAEAQVPFLNRAALVVPRGRLRASAQPASYSLSTLLPRPSSLSRGR